MRVRVTVPASGGNLGSAFDVAGVAYGLTNDVIVDTALSGVEVEGEGADELREGADNLVRTAMDYFARETGRRVPACGMRLVNHIPFSRGLGSSAAAIVGGLLAADALSDGRLPREDILRLATNLEGHPDNVSAALYGGIVLTASDIVCRLDVPADWRAVLYVPDLHLPTSEARAVLPPSVPRSDAVFNLSRAGLLIAAAARNRPEWLRVAMEDRLHQPYRAKLFPAMTELIRDALDGGAWGACLSGAGSAILAMCSAAKAQAVAQALERSARAQAVAGRVLVLEIPQAGACVKILSSCESS